MKKIYFVVLNALLYIFLVSSLLFASVIENEINYVPRPWKQDDPSNHSASMLFTYAPKDVVEGELIVIVEGPLPSDFTVKEYAEGVKKDSFSTFKGYKEIFKRKASLHGKEFIVQSFELYIDGEKSRAEAYLFVEHETGFIFFFDTYSKWYNRMRPEMERLISNSDFFQAVMDGLERDIFEIHDQEGMIDESEYDFPEEDASSTVKRVAIPDEKKWSMSKQELIDKTMSIDIRKPITPGDAEIFIEYVQRAHSDLFPEEEGYPSIGVAMEKFFGNPIWKCHPDYDYGVSVSVSGIARYGERNVKMQILISRVSMSKFGIILTSPNPLFRNSIPVIFVNGEQTGLSLNDVLSTAYLN